MTWLEALLVSLLSAVIGGAVVAFTNHALTRRRESERKLLDLRVQTLIDAWKKVEKASNPENIDHDKDRINELYSGLEDAIASILLLGSKKEVSLAHTFSKQLSEGRRDSATELLNSLRASVRSELALEAVPDMLFFFRMQRKK